VTSTVASAKPASSGSISKGKIARTPSEQRGVNVGEMQLAVTFNRTQKSLVVTVKTAHELTFKDTSRRDGLL
jgi:hypothetical protein